MFFDPQVHTARGVSYDTVIRGIRRAQMEADIARAMWPWITQLRKNVLFIGKIKRRVDLACCFP